MPISTLRYVYLDTSHQHWLAEWADTSQSAFDEFRARWREFHCALVVTRAHLIELWRERQPEVRRRRFALYRSLAPIVSDISPSRNGPDFPPLLVEREVLTVLLVTGHLKMTNTDPEQMLARYTAALPGRFDEPQEAQLLEVLEHPVFDAPLRMMESALQTGADARTRPYGSPYSLTGVDELPNKPPSPEKLAEARRTAEAVITDPANWPDLSAVLSAEMIADVQSRAMGLMDDLLTKIELSGPRAAFLEHVGIEDERSASRQPTAKLIQRHLFEEVAARVILRYAEAGSNLQSIQALARSIPTELCPGTWLRDAVELEVRKGKPTAYVSDEFDFEHVAFLPYVDVLTADANVTQACEQVLRRSGLPPLLQGLPGPLRARDRSQLITKLWAALGHVVGATSVS